MRPTKKKCDPRPYPEYTGQGYDKRKCPSRIVITDDENVRIPAKRSLLY